MQAIFAIRCCAWLCLFGPVFLAGCGGSTAQVTGKVISQGKPVVEAIRTTGVTVPLAQ